MKTASKISANHITGVGAFYLKDENGEIIDIYKSDDGYLTETWQQLAGIGFELAEEPEVDLLNLAFGKDQDFLGQTTQTDIITFCHILNVQAEDYISHRETIQYYRDPDMKQALEISDLLEDNPIKWIERIQQSQAKAVFDFGREVFNEVARHCDVKDYGYTYVMLGGTKTDYANHKENEKYYVLIRSDLLPAIQAALPQGKTVKPTNTPQSAYRY